MMPQQSQICTKNLCQNAFNKYVLPEKILRTSFRKTTLPEKFFRTSFRKTTDRVKTGDSKTRLDSQTRVLPEGKERVDVPKTVKTKVGSTKVPKAPKGDLGIKGNRVKGYLPLPKRIEVHVDWLQFSGEIINHEEEVDFDREGLFRYIEEMTNEGILRSRNHGLNIAPGVSYQHSGRSENGVKVAWNSCNGKIYIVIPGKVLSQMEVSKVWEMSKYILLNYRHIHCTRIDIALDDYAKRLDPHLIYLALQNGNYSKFKTKRVNSKLEGDWSFRLGTAESDRSTEIYNKEAESKGKIKAYRIEGRFRHKVAHQVLQKWLAIDKEQTCTIHSDKIGGKYIKRNEDWEKESCNYLIGSVIGSFDFINRQVKPNEKNLNRIPRLDWWEAFVNDLDCPEEIYHTRPVVAPTLATSTKWLHNQVRRVLFCVLSAFGKDAHDWFLNQMESAKGSLNERHIQRIERYTREYQIHKGEFDFCIA